MRSLRAAVDHLRASKTAESRAVRSGVVAASTNLALLLWKFAGNVVLAHLLMPRDFGVANICFLVMTAVVLLSDAGLDTAVVRSPRGEDPAFLNVVWTMGILRAVGMWIAVVVAAVPVARVYREPALAMMLPVLGFSILVESGRSTYLELCDRRLELRPRMMLELRGQVLTTLVQLAAAYYWRSAWAIVLGALTASIYRFVESHRLNDGPRNRLAWNGEYAAEILAFGKWIFLSTALTFVASQGDRALLGRVMSLEMLGIYGIAATVAQVPQQINGVIATRVIFPLVSEYIRVRPTELGPRLRRARTVVLAGMLLAVTAVIVASGPFFELLYKNEYRQAGALAPALAWISWVAILQNSVDRLPVAFGDSRLLSVVSFVSMVAKLTGGLGGFMFGGLPGFLIGLFVGSVLEYAAAQAIAVRKYGVRLVGQDLRFTAALVVVSVVAYVIHGMSLAIRVGVGTLLVLGIGVFVARLYAKRAHANAAGGSEGGAETGTGTGTGAGAGAGARAGAEPVLPS